MEFPIICNIDYTVVFLIPINFPHSRSEWQNWIYRKWLGKKRSSNIIYNYTVIITLYDSYWPIYDIHESGCSSGTVFSLPHWLLFNPLVEIDDKGFAVS